MSHAEENLDEVLDRQLGLFRISSHPLPEATRDAMLRRLRAQVAASAHDQSRPKHGRRWLTFYAAAAVAVVVVLVLAIESRRVGEKAPVSAGEGSLASHPVPQGHTAFEVVSIRPEASPSGRGRGSGPASALVRCGRPYLRVQVTPDRFVASASVYDLLALAYGKDCLSLTGGPDWASSDVFAIQAIIPVGTPAYSATHLRDGEAPELQSMIQTLLRQRFQLVLRHETREVDVYNLVTVKTDKLRLANPNAPPRRGPRVPTLGSLDTTIRRFADGLAGQLERPVIDKTGLRNSYRMVLEFPELADPPIGPNGAPLRMRDLIPEKLEEQLGLRLQPSRTALEMFVIDHVEKPTEN